METYFYECPACGFVYSVPAYWMSFSPDETTEFPHMDARNNDLCANMTLELDESMQPTE